MNKNGPIHLGGAWSLVRIQSPRQFINDYKSNNYATIRAMMQDKNGNKYLHFGCIWLHLVAKNVLNSCCENRTGRRQS